MTRRPVAARVASLAFALAGFTAALDAHATGGLQVPDIGAQQVGRGGAWVARANDPIAAHTNPSAMSFQASGVHLGAHLMFQGGCFTRLGPDGEPVSPGNAIPGPGAENGPAGETCTSSVFPNPQLAAVFRVTDELALGLAVVGPHAAGIVDWPESVDYERNGRARTQPAPNRYLLVSQSSMLIFPTISASYAVTPELAFGAGFVWGIAAVDFTTFTESTSSSNEDDFTRDVRARLNAQDLFVPGFVLGASWRASKYFDLGASYRFSDKISSRTRLELTSQYWLAGGARNEEPCPADDPECNVTVDEDAGSLEFSIPMDAQLGARFHLPLEDASDRPDWAKGSGYVRDPLSQDLFDVELDLTWANNSAVDNILLRFDPGIAVKGTPGEVPQNGDIPHEWDDVLGVRLGSDVTVLPNLLGLRAGGFFESKGQDDAYLNLDFHMGWKAGVSAGGVVRLGPVDLDVAYAHVFYGTLDNGGNGAVRALSGDATTDYRSQQAINGGRFSQSLDEVALGGTLRF
jgi:long-subunit fatty acid transport protein